MNMQRTVPTSVYNSADAKLVLSERVDCNCSAVTVDIENIVQGQEKLRVHKDRVLIFTSVVFIPQFHLVHYLDQVITRM